MFKDLLTVEKETNIPKERLIGLIETEQLNGVLITDGNRVVTGLISEEDVQSLMETE